ncbi:ABC transporter substrate-binding protein [Halogeometricum sp. S3BR5-2]|uniref:ABC transporter substrate-binding protein n=1 Tax=Halogeometricum luteum TaxID=2950537 RepID=A0ABU2G0H2_9EURY|nr:ABC transporter substrate-binding protein [Halogeometricum sp. S3BR5-2]MDS0293739.1 ABC transporter substrate-binding protein [Halogeometricum sp. S3BR5-2]
MESRLPAPGDRPTAALLFAGDEPEDFAPYRVSGEGANKEHFRTLGISDAFEGTGVEGYSGSEAVDYETLLEVDPDSLLLRYHGNKTRAEFETTTVSYVGEHELGSRLSAVRNGMMFRGSPIYCGPLHNLFMIERYATGLFPETFTEDRLFDRQRLADIVTGGDQS